MGNSTLASLTVNTDFAETEVDAAPLASVVTWVALRDAPAPLAAKLTTTPAARLPSARLTRTLSGRGSREDTGAFWLSPLLMSKRETELADGATKVA